MYPHVDYFIRFEHLEMFVWYVKWPCCRDAPQTGVELDAMSFRALGSRAAVGTLTLREVGSPMLPMWPSYFAECA